MKASADSQGPGRWCQTEYPPIRTDFDDDGWIDVFVGNDLMQNYLWLYQGDGTESSHRVRRRLGLYEGRTAGREPWAAGDVTLDSSRIQSPPQ